MRIINMYLVPPHSRITFWVRMIIDIHRVLLVFVSHNNLFTTYSIQVVVESYLYLRAL